MSWSGYILAARQHWRSAVPYCGEQGCGLLRRLWRRIRWWNGAIRLQGSTYCAPQCFERAALQCLARVSRPGLSPPPPRHRIPLGLLMLSRGQLTNHQLREALQAQQASGRHRLGEWLEKLGFATEQQVTAALGLQWACPILTAQVSPDRSCLLLLPYRLLEHFRILPVQYVRASRTFYLAFSEGINYSVLHAIEEMLDCRTEACLIGSRAMEQALEQISGERGRRDLLFEGWRDAAEMARITCSYVLKLGAEAVRAVGCGEYVWVRLEAGGENANLLFKCHSAVPCEALTSRSFSLPITG